MKRVRYFYSHSLDAHTFDADEEEFEDDELPDDKELSDSAWEIATQNLETWFVVEDVE